MLKKQTITHVFSLLFVCFFIGCTTVSQNCSGCEKARKLNPRISFTTKTGAKKTIYVELACTEKERAKGLMFRKNLPENKGMLFIFAQSSTHSFWMRNTFIPLDMIHIDKEKNIVGIVEDAKPHDESSHTVNKKAKYVLEVNAFFSKEHGIKKGSHVTFTDIPNCVKTNL